MLEMKITIEAPELAATISKLADAIAAGRSCLCGGPVPASEAAPAAVPAAVPVSAVPATASVTPLVVVPDQAAAPVVPVADAPTYTMDQIARAGAALVDAGKMEQLLTLLGQYGVRAVTQLRPDQYGAFATELRGLGAQI